MKIQEYSWDNALKLMPRGTQTMSKCPDQFVDGVYPKFALSAEGCYITCEDGKEYLDFMCGLGPIILGYNHKRTKEAISNQMDKGIIFSLPSYLEQELAKLMIDVIPCAEQVRFAKNGTDADLAAVRIARSYTGREHIAKCGYHGWGDWNAISLRDHGVPKSLKKIVHDFEYNNLQSLEKVLLDYECAAVIMEAQALTSPDPGFLQGVRDLCDKYGSILIFDEVVTGFRWSLGGAQEYFGVTPDLACFGKAMANGMPISAIAGKRKNMQELNHAFFSTTFGGECLSLAASIETIKELKEKDYGHIWELGDMFSKGMYRIAKQVGLKINFAGSGPRHNLTFCLDYENPSLMKDVFYQEMCKQNILFSNVLYINFAHKKTDIEKTLKAAEIAFSFVYKNLNRLEEVLEGKPSVSVFRKNT